MLTYDDLVKMRSSEAGSSATLKPQNFTPAPAAKPYVPAPAPKFYTPASTTKSYTPPISSSPSFVDTLKSKLLSAGAAVQSLIPQSVQKPIQSGVKSIGTNFSNSMPKTPLDAAAFAIAPPIFMGGRKFSQSVDPQTALDVAQAPEAVGMGLSGGQLSFTKALYGEKLPEPTTTLGKVARGAGYALPITVSGAYSLPTTALAGVIGGGSKVASNVISKKPAFEGVETAAAEGAGSAWQIALGQGIANKVASKLIPSLSNAGVEAASSSGKFVKDLGINLGRALLETPIDAAVITGVQSLDPQNREHFMELVASNLAGSFAGNVGFSALGPLYRGLGKPGAKAVSEAVTKAWDQYQAMTPFEKQRGSIDLGAKVGGKEDQTINDVGKTQFEKQQYGMSHRPSYEGMPPAYNLLEGETLPRDVYTHPDFSISTGRLRSGDKAATESWKALQEIKGKPDAEITIYRASPKNELNTGDWVTFSKDYAKQSVEGTEKVHSFKVKAKDIIFAGDDINEFGYYPSQPPAGKKTGGVVPPDATVPGAVPPGMKERGFITTVKASENTPAAAKENLEGFYKPETNPQQGANAENIIQTLGIDGATKKAASDLWSGENAVLYQKLAAEAYSGGRFDEGDSLINAAAVKATRAGQGNQALSLWSKFTPEGMVRYAKREVENASNNKPLLNRILGKDMKWTPEDSKVITGMMREVNSLPEGNAKIAATRRVFKYISGKLPWGASNVIDEFRYNNMLSNPLTQLRNAVNNLAQAFIVRPATLAFSDPKGAVKYEIAALKSIPDAVDSFKKAFSGESKFAKMDLSDVGNQLRVPKKLGAYNIPSDAMEGMDKFFSKIIESGELARGASPAEATRLAEYSLFRGDLKPAEQGGVLNAIDTATGAIYQLRKVGLGWFIPFLRTPMNVAKQWLEYSPLGLSTVSGAANKKEQLAKAALGSIATLIGAGFAMEGNTTWEAPTDPDEKNLFYDSGRKPYSVNIPKIGWVPMQTFGVFALALALPAAYKYHTEDSRTALSDDQLTKLENIALSIPKFWSQQTFVANLGAFVNLMEGNADYSVTRSLSQMAGQLNPMAGLQRYIATVLDPVFRHPSSTSFSEQMMTGIPELSKKLPAYTSMTGQPSTRNLSNYIAPYAIGVPNPQFESWYQSRKSKLQRNSLENSRKAKFKRDLLKSSNNGLGTFITDEQFNSAITGRR